ncbi:hypothetical protein FRB99_000136 [Tulasnella sp. 403]|nr:hypothetical protein FRB99_000136 [Tulasnella sp. 403]
MHLIVATVALGASSAYALFAPRQTMDQLWNGYNITAESLRVRDAISKPTCNATTACLDFTGKVIPKCLSLQGSPGCWCAYPDELHYCAICMSNPTDNTTTPQQTQDATEGHANYHKGCGAYQAFLNASASGLLTSSAHATSSYLPTASAAPSNSGSSHLNSGALAGIIVGGVVGVAIIIALAVLLYRHLQNKHESKLVGADLDHNTGATLVGHGEPKYPSNTPPPPAFVPYTMQPVPQSPNSTAGYTTSNQRESTFSSAFDSRMTDTHSLMATPPASAQSPPPPFAPYPDLPLRDPASAGYDTSLLHGVGTASGKGGFSNAPEPMR